MSTTKKIVLAITYNKERDGSFEEMQRKINHFKHDSVFIIEPHKVDNPVFQLVYPLNMDERVTQLFHQLFKNTKIE